MILAIHCPSKFSLAMTTTPRLRKPDRRQNAPVPDRRKSGRGRMRDVVEMVGAFNLPGDRAAETADRGDAAAAIRRVFSRWEGVSLVLEAFS